MIDEFALLVERQPEVRDRLDTIATQGRSLGIHLLLATQSPSGVITHAIRTNTNLWICLRVVTESESMEILGTQGRGPDPRRLARPGYRPAGRRRRPAHVPGGANRPTSRRRGVSGASSLG